VNEQIAVDPRIYHGQAWIKGTRIPVPHIVHMLANGDSVEELLHEYPSLTREDVLASLGYTTSLSRKQGNPIDKKG